MTDPPHGATAQRLEAWLHRFVGERHLATSPRRHDETAELVASTFAAAGLEVETQPVRGPHRWGHNVIGRRAGRSGSDRVWIVGAHYDTVQGTPGADDNGVAVAALLEAAAWLGRLDPADSIELVAWDLEEMQGVAGYALGSRTMARETRRGGREVAGVLDLEMIGCCHAEPQSQRFPPGFGLLFRKVRRWVAERDGRGDFLCVVTDRRSVSLAEAFESAAERHQLPVARLEVLGAARLLPDLYRSDHVGFWNRGIPALMLTDSADFRNDHYHQPTDTLDTLDFGFAARVLAAVRDTVETLAGNAAGTNWSAASSGQEDVRNQPSDGTERR